jgi:anaerobic selenocysteine-containing dehydrogenase
MQTAICLGGNLFGSNPDAKFAAQALAKLDHITYLSTTLNTGHPWGTAKETLILPVLPRDEEPQPTTQESMFSYVRFSDGGPARHAGPRSEVSVLTTLGQAVVGQGGAGNWRELESHERIRQLIAEMIPGYEPIADIDKTRKEFSIAGRRLDARSFPTASGKAKFHAVSVPASIRPQKGQLQLMTVRSEGQFNTVVYEEEDLYRNQERRDIILISPEDLEQLGLKPDQRVTVRNEVGIMRHQLVRPFDIRPGNALMYYPESNVLVPRAVDPQSKTPAFKSVLVTLEAEPAGSEREPQLPLVALRT